uniref:Cation-transporting P-type ATPase N-terminal domain-containing protein n=1 Tax=Compsopogon caeruleus TaxID=31354 RepID=A0A6T6CYV8_9RHOD|mmetsp:Transcript_9189/g.18697  ORF Transcript_9189/g.18697 Transcript_9189/m.18697 type:complete len:1176 (+) Transcript_9189:130-3657(+)|eukprot:CAMPEP_0184689142 /NCGR_PEP_ID=MMETSP0312-20130426/30490_1 /TAXON_ID=31354 /ORGANISM="Compsopogon coeruleus, Strain SAG 36.94" /LENGTH=1175 /DNA_ID=CAMNT_0027146457 /DNA_START=99 /DNA_END=3626 /DNA_ORIENTATION=-
MVDGPDGPPSRVSRTSRSTPRPSVSDADVIARYSEVRERFSEALEREKAGKKVQANVREELREVELWEHKVPVDELCFKLGTDVDQGLSGKDHQARLERDGPNVLSPPKVTPWYWKLLAQFGNFFAILLQVGGILCFIGYGLDGSKENLFLGLVLFVVVAATALFTFAQEFKSEKTMEKFKNFLPPVTLARRDGRTIEVPAETLVVGDIVEVKAGDKIPADIRIVEVSKLKVDNSSLTGESEPIGLGTQCTDENPLETKNLAFFGTLAVDGTATGVVINTGDRTIFGRIAALAGAAKLEQTTLQREIHHFIVIISAFAISMGVIFFIFGLIKGSPILTNIVSCIGIIVANIPEGLLATVTVSLTLAAKRMAKKHVLVKKLECVETLGSTTTICSDKTGTLTQNRMTVVHLLYDNEIFTTKTATTEATFDMQNPAMKALFFAGCSCSKAVFDAKDMEDYPSKSIDERKINGDASESGILRFTSQIEDVTVIRQSNPQIGGIPFNSTNKFMVTIHRDASESGNKRLLMKGAPERILERCTKYLSSSGVRPLDAAALQDINAKLLTLMNGGERVLGFAHTLLEDPPFDDSYIFDSDNPNFPLEDLTFIGLMALLDPPKESVPESVKTCQMAGIQVIMVTGDHPATAKSIAKQVYIIRDPTVEDVAAQRNVHVDAVDRSEIRAIVVAGSELKDFEEEDWDRVLRHDQIVFARTSPQQKLIIVENCQRLDKIVAVTGDGVNDSPALKKANIGVSMGISGSDVSKEAADMVLLDDNFASIVHAVEEGRIIFDNLKKSIAYTLAKNVPQITPYLVFVVTAIPLPLTTVLILSIDLGTDIIPAIALAHEKAESDIMKRKPRDAKRDHLVNERMISFTYFQIGIIQSAAGFFTYFTLFNDFGISPSLVYQLDGEGYFAPERHEDRRWLVTSRDDVGKTSFSRNWYDDQVGAFATVINSQQFEFQFENVSKRPVAGDTGNSAFQDMIRTVGNTLQIPPCLAYSCRPSGSNVVYNDFGSCFTGVNASTKINLYGINDGNLNPNVKAATPDTRGQAGNGCFELWSFEQQEKVHKKSQVAFFITIVVTQYFNLIICKTRVLSIFQQGMSNWWLNVGILSETIIAVALAYAPFLHRIFGTINVSGLYWLTGIPFSLYLFFYDETRKFFMRKGIYHGNKFGLWIQKFSYW